MATQLRLPLAAVWLAVLLGFPAGTSAAGPLPDPPIAVPAVPGNPGVTVTPTGDGATVEAGAGDTVLSVGAGRSGVTAGTRPRNSNPGAGRGNPVDSMPVGTPGDRPGRRLRNTTAGSGPGAVVFGDPASAARAGRAQRLDGNRTRAGGGVAPGRRNGSASRTVAVPGGQEHSRLAPFFEFIDRVPPIVRAGIVLLALIAIGIWAAWVRTRRRLAMNAFVDPVTGIANAAAFEGLLERELERAKRYKRPLALILLEVGAPEHTGLLTLRDQTLRDVTKSIREGVREGDTIARLGQSRFAVISPEATIASAETLARALELRIEALRVHVSAGIAERQPTDLGPRDLLARAEAELPQAGDEDKPARLRPVLRAA
jgi:diguanylate cyclase (GGDEF)-like protein